ncbi:MAG: 6-phosphofructokinase [Firmicutes bacterium]|nr:6-phosphofructokinase [Candidatus Fiminaster equi]
MPKIAVLTSGGDAPGMNACVRAVVRSGIKQGCEMFVVYEGFKGLVEGRIEPVDRNFVSDTINRGGTILRSARLPEFKEEAIQKMAIKQLESYGIDSLIVIGGDGTYRGAKDLAAKGIHTIGIPASIDNDVCSTQECIGFDTCQNTICDCVDKIRDTSASHARCTFIEVMGNKCGDLALYSGLAEGVEIVISNDHPYTEEDVVNKLKSLKGGKKKHALVIVSEKIFPNIFDFAKKVTEKTGIECRAEVLGHLQRGGSPTAHDRIIATRFGVEAVQAILDGDSSVALGLFGGEIKRVPFEEAFIMERDIHKDLLHILKLVNR